MPLYMKLVLGIHSFSGFAVIFLGLLIYFLRKGGKSHTKLGWAYHWSMMLISLSGLGLIIYRFNAFLVLILALTFYLSHSGAFAFRRKADQPSSLDRILAAVATLTGIWGIGYGVYLIATSGVQALPFLFMLFGFLLGANAYNDFKWFKTPGLMTGKWRVEYHLTRMGASFIAATTAFGLFGARRIIGEIDHVWILWVAPTVIGSLLMSYYKRVYLKRNLKKVQTSK